MLDDSALVYRAEQGLVILSGCAHSGICNIIAYASRLTGERRIAAVLGGFHLTEQKQQQLQRTIETLKPLPIAQLYPCHCTCLKAKMALQEVAPVAEIGVGSVLCWDEDESPATR